MSERDASDDSPDRPLPARRIVAFALAGLAWVVALGLVGFVSSRPDPMIGDRAQQVLFTYIVLLPATLWAGLRLRRRRTTANANPMVAAGRRQLLADGVIVVGGSVAASTVASTALFATADPQTAATTVRAEYGSLGGERVLVAYASQFGSTAEIADTVAATLATTGSRVDVRHVRDVPNVAGYDCVIVGGAIQYDRWMGDAANFVQAHRAHLATIPVAFFFTCLALSRPGQAGIDAAAGYERKIRAIAPELQPDSVKGFAGVLDYSRMTPVARIFARVLLTLRGADPGDHRNWSEITAWSRTLNATTNPRPHRDTANQEAQP